MLIHIIPRLLLPYAGHTIQGQLIDLTIDEFGLVLKGGKDLATRRPYQNKRYLVGCRKSGQKAINGILVETSHCVRSYTTVARWAVHAENIITHRTHYIVLDNEFDAVSDNMSLWYATSASLGGWSSRWPEWANGLTPVSAQPRMDVVPTTDSRSQRQGEVEDMFSNDGSMVRRVETFRLPTIERGRLQGKLAVMDRLPAMDAVFWSDSDVADTESVRHSLTVG